MENVRQKSSSEIDHKVVKLRNERLGSVKGAANCNIDHVLVRN